MTARITGEDCCRVVPNRFEVVALAAERARSLRLGARPAVPTGRESAPVIALRELAAGRLPIDEIRGLALKRRKLRDPPAAEILPLRPPWTLLGVVAAEAG